MEQDLKSEFSIDSACIYRKEFAANPPKVLGPKCQLLSRKEVKDKAIPLQTWIGPEGSRSLRLPDFKTIGV